MVVQLSLSVSAMPCPVPQYHHAVTLQKYRAWYVFPPPGQHRLKSADFIIRCR